MEKQLSNAFSLLALADDEDGLPSSSSSSAGNLPMKKVSAFQFTISIHVSNSFFFSGKQGERVVEDVGNYKQPLVWIDLEMTGNVFQSCSCP